MVPSRSKKTAGTRLSVEAVIYLVERDVAPRAQINSLMPSESFALACPLRREHSRMGQDISYSLPDTLRDSSTALGITEE